MKIQKVLLGTVIAATLGMAAPAMAFEKGVTLSADAGSHFSWGSTIEVNGHLNSLSLSRFAIGGDSVDTLNYKVLVSEYNKPLRLTVGLSGMKSDYSSKDKIKTGDYEAGYALGVSMGIGYDAVSTGTSFDISLTEEFAESRFEDGKVFDVFITQRITENASLKFGFRQIDREINGEKDELLETGYMGLKFNF